MSLTDTYVTGKSGQLLLMPSTLQYESVAPAQRWSEACGEDESQKHEAQLNGDYYEQYEDEAELVQVDVWVGEGVTEGGVDDHE